jgi:hypothetical protein
MNRKEIIQTAVCNYVRTRYEMIKPEPTLGLFNFRCFENAVEYARRYPELEVIEVIYLDGGVPILHYINRDPANGKYLETTLGWRAQYLEYYHIRKIHPDDHRYLPGEFDRSLGSWLHQFTTWFDRKVLRIGRIL